MTASKDGGKFLPELVVFDLGEYFFSSPSV